MNREKLKRIVESIEAAEKAIKTYSDHKREIYATNKDEFDPKVLRKIIARRKLDPDSRTKDDDLLDQYETALGMTGELAKAAASGALTYQEAADEARVGKRTMARHVKRARGVPESTDDGIDPETGEITETAPDSPPSPAPESRVGPGTHSVEQGDRQSPLRDGGAPVATSTAGPAVTTSVFPPDHRTPAEIVGELPDFLRRVPA